MRSWLESSAVLLVLAGCNAPEPPANSGGTSVAAGPCGRGVVVVHSDHTASTNVSLLGLDGVVLSPSFYSSATSDVGLSPPLGSDVVVPTPPLTGSEILVIDRFPASVLTWIDVQTAKPRAQLVVGDRTNPHDYLALDDTKAYVSRYETNDIAIVDPTQPAVVDTIALSAAMDGDPEFRANPGRMAHAGGSVYVVLESLAAGFDDSLPSRLVRIDPASDAIADVLVLDDVHGCAGLAVSPDESELALACSGGWRGTSEPELSTSHVVRVSIGAEMKEIGRLSAASFGSEPFAFGLDYASNGSLFALRFGNEQGNQDSLLWIDLDTGAGEVVLSGPAFTLGDVRCAAGCNVCFAADADRGVVHRFELSAGEVTQSSSIAVDQVTGLPPRSLGRF